MSFHTADYDVYFILGDPAARPLWNWRVWQSFVPAIDPLMETARGKPALRCIQYLPKRAGKVKFGRLVWKESDHQKWAHQSPANEEKSKSWQFLNLEVWAPTWTACEHDDSAPDVFFALSNEALGAGYGQKLLFNPVVVLAIVTQLAKRESSHVSPALVALRKLTSPRLTGYRRRPWGIASGSVGFSNSVQDLSFHGLFKPGPRHKGKVGFHLLREKWRSW
jgi:hypothetical protein